MAAAAKTAREKREEERRTARSEIMCVTLTMP
jgi:hypothetical protein